MILEMQGYCVSINQPTRPQLGFVLRYVQRATEATDLASPEIIHNVDICSYHSRIPMMCGEEDNDGDSISRCNGRTSFMLSHQMHGRQDYFFDDDVLLLSDDVLVVTDSIPSPVYFALNYFLFDLFCFV